MLLAKANKATINLINLEKCTRCSQGDRRARAVQFWKDLLRGGRGPRISAASHLRLHSIHRGTLDRSGEAVSDRQAFLHSVCVRRSEQTRSRSSLCTLVHRCSSLRFGFLPKTELKLFTVWCRKPGYTSLQTHRGSSHYTVPRPTLCDWKNSAFKVSFLK